MGESEGLESLSATSAIPSRRSLSRSARIWRCPTAVRTSTPEAIACANSARINECMQIGQGKYCVSL